MHPQTLKLLFRSIEKNNLHLNNLKIISSENWVNGQSLVSNCKSSCGLKMHSLLNIKIHLEFATKI